MITTTALVTSLISGLASGTITYHYVKNYKISKDSDYVKIQNINEHSKLKDKDILNVKVFNSKEHGSYVKHFYDVLRGISTDEELRIMHNNLDTLEILSFDFDENKDNIMGLYILSNNTLSVPVNKPEVSIYHELFHMASSYKENNTIYSGFYQVKHGRNGYNIGSSINEGYTELLTLKYFKDKNLDTGYAFETYMCMLLEMIIDDEKLKHLYLTANLKGLIDELCKYTNYDDVNKFLYYMDFVSKYRIEPYLDMDTNNIYEYAIEYVLNFAYRIYTTKLDIESELYGFTEDMKDTMIKHMIDLMSTLNRKQLYKKVK